MIAEKDPWESVPRERRLDFKVIGEPLKSLAEATINKVEREWPKYFRHIPGAQVLFRLLTLVAVTTYETTKYFCAETPEDPARKISFASSAPPLLRSLLDEIYAVVFIGEEMESRVAWYYRAGWREMAERYALYKERYSEEPAWGKWLEDYGRYLEWTRADWGITDTEAGDLKSIPRWPIPSKMARNRGLSEDSKKLFEYLEAWFYRELSQETHLSYPGLAHRGSTFLRGRDDPLKENEWRKKRSDAAGYAIVLLLAFLSEVNSLCGFDLDEKCLYLWGVLKEYFPIADELYGERYRLLLERGSMGRDEPKRTELKGT